MPANLSPEYQHAELRYRQATTDEERLACLREMLSALPKHKGTEKMQGDLKHRISQMSKGGTKVVKSADPFHVPPNGAGQVVLIGAPNAGKSAILAAATNAQAKVADYPFTTTMPQPGMAAFGDVQIQLVDTPPMTDEVVPPGLFGCIRSADAVCVVVDAAGNALEEAEMTLRLMAERGVTLRSVPRNELDIAAETAQLSGLIAANKADVAEPGAVKALEDLYPDLRVVPVSAVTKEGLGRLVEELWRLLALVRVYTRRAGRKERNEEPFTLPAGSTVEHLAREIHRDLPAKMKHARVWGAGRHDGQPVSRFEPLREGDTVEIHE